MSFQPPANRSATWRHHDACANAPRWTLGFGKVPGSEGVIGAAEPAGLVIEEPRSYSMKLTSQISSATCLIPTFWPAD